MNDLVQQIFLSFARFPAHAGVMKIFNRGGSGLVTDAYISMMLAANGLSEKNLVPEILDYVFASNEKRARAAIDNISGFYLLVDYGQIESWKGEHEIARESFYIAATVAHPANTDELDMAEETIISDLCLQYLKQIRNHMKLQDRDRFLKELQFPHSATPFAAPDLNNSIGWTMIMTRENAGLL